MTREDLVELEAIKRLKYRYCRLLDRKQWDEMAECFLPDATAAYGDGKYSFEGRDAILGFLRDALGATMLTNHQVSQPEIELTSATTATGTWALRDHVIETKHGLTIEGAAFYDDEYVKVDGAWRIRHTGYKRTYEEIQSREGVPGLRLTADWFATDGRSSLI